MRALAKMAIPAAAFLVIIGCGGENDAGRSDTEGDVRAAVAEYFYASADNDSAAVCNALTAKGRERLVDGAPLEVARSADDCEEAAAEFFNSLAERREEIADGARKLADGIKSGEIDGDPVEVEVDSNAATVTFKVAGDVFRAPVKRVGGDWRLADPSLTAATTPAADK